MSDMEKYILLTVDGRYNVVSICPEKLLKGFYRALSCEMIEVVHVDKTSLVLPAEDGFSPIFVIDECGYVDGKPVNSFASALYAGSAYGDFIHGDVLLASIGSRSGEPDIVGLTSSQCLTFLFNLHHVAFDNPPKLDKSLRFD